MNMKSLGVAALLMAGTTPALALDSGRQLLITGNIQGMHASQWTAPGLSTVFDNNQPLNGKGEEAAQIRMPAGTLSNFRVKIVTANPPTSGSMIVRVRINGDNTALSCRLTRAGICTKAAAVAVATNDKVAIEVSNTFAGTDDIAWTATLEFD